MHRPSTRRASKLKLSRSKTRIAGAQQTVHEGWLHAAVIKTHNAMGEKHKDDEVK